MTFRSSRFGELSKSIDEFGGGAVSFAMATAFQTLLACRPSLIALLKTVRCCAVHSKSESWVLENTLILRARQVPQPVEEPGILMTMAANDLPLVQMKLKEPKNMREQR
jgi:hypothetical protein